MVLIAFLMSALSTRDALGTSWEQQPKLRASDGSAVDYFGCSTSLSGSIAAIGAWGDDDRGNNSGSIYIFENGGAGWTETTKLTALDGAAGDEFGQCVSISGTTVIGGAQWDDDRGNYSGAAYVFEETEGGWTQAAKLLGTDTAAGDLFGSGVSVCDTLVLIGAPWDDDCGSFSGSAYVFQRSGTTWSQVAKLTASDGAEWDQFGECVYLDGTTAIIGAYGDDDCGDYTGSAYVFEKSGSSWSSGFRLTASYRAGGDSFGSSACLDGSIAIVGARGDDDCGGSSGAAYIFEDNGTAWVQTAKLIASDAAAGDQFGCSVFIEGARAFVGAYHDDDCGLGSGSVYVFEKSGVAWTQIAKLTASDGEAGDYFGHDVSACNGTILVGSVKNDNRDLVIPGDANRDTKVDGADLSLWQQNYDPLGNVADNWAMGNWNGDTRIDGGDLALWQQHYDPLGWQIAGAAYVFEEVLTSVAAGEITMREAVPEPGTLLLIASVLATLRGVVRRRR